jgi:hypothetical protein
MTVYFSSVNYGDADMMCNENWLFKSGISNVFKVFGTSLNVLISVPIERGWRKLHIEEFHNLYALPDIIRMSKSRKIRWEGCIACMGAKRCIYSW